MASVITIAFEGWKAQEAATGKPVLLNEFVFANVPNLDPTKPIDRNEKLPPANQIVHRQAVNKAGLVSENAVAYSVTLGADVGDFDFNWIGLLNKESGIIAMITHAPLQKKLKTQNGQQGNVLIRSFLLEFNGAAEETQIKTSAETWQIDFTARLSGMDEMQRLINVDNYGAAAFFNDGFEVTRSGEQYTVKKGLGYVGGLRGQLEQNQILNGLRNTKIYADFSYQGNIVSQWSTVIKITAVSTLSNYVDAAGFTHQVFAIASIDTSGNVKDLRPMGALNSQEISALETRFKLDLSKKIDKANITNQTGNSSELVVSQQLVTTELGKKQPNGNYATKEELNTGLDEKLGTNAIVQSGGQSTNVIMSQKAVTDMSLKKLDKTGGEMTGPLITPRVESSKLTGDNKQILNANGATVYLGNTDSVAAVRLESNNGAAYVTRGSEAFRIFHQGFKPSASDVDAISTSMNYALVPIGASVIWNTSAPIPANFWANEGRSFSATEYPEAAKAMPDLKVPDDRGYAIRAADNGRGIDTGRTVGTYQQDAMRNLTGSIIAKGLATTSSLTADGVFRRDETYKNSDSQPGGTTWVGQGFTFDASRQVSVANEFRMKNVAKILITRMK
ncbi:phage tail-collar fiber domain-containing protein [Providencia alcalifaciens]|uniref:phage tail-collar fiber domain-containing protein n=1 Tax=Providencia alcalifaciens TaxID=126385 RepID=UPI003D9980EE